MDKLNKIAVGIQAKFGMGEIVYNKIKSSFVVVVGIFDTRFQRMRIEGDDEYCDIRYFTTNESGMTDVSAKEGDLCSLDDAEKYIRKDCKRAVQEALRIRKAFLNTKRRGNLINKLNEVTDDEPLVEIEIDTEYPEDVSLECDESACFTLTTKKEVLKNGMKSLLEDDCIVLLKAEAITPVFDLQEYLKDHLDEPVLQCDDWQEFVTEYYLTDQAESLDMYEDWYDRVYVDLDKDLMYEFEDHLNKVVEDKLGGLRQEVSDALNQKLVQRFTDHLNNAMRKNAGYLWDSETDILFVNNAVVEDLHPQNPKKKSNVSIYLDEKYQGDYSKTWEANKDHLGKQL